jgi:hypothetical protein
MVEWVRWAAPAVAAVVLTQPVAATQYLTIATASKAAFPSATSFVPAHVAFTAADVAAIQQMSGQPVKTQGEQVWKAYAGTTFLGYFIVDYVIGKHLVIDYSISLDPGGAVRRVDIMEYREAYGGEVRNAGWLGQFVGKTLASPLQLNSDINNIAGATLSSRHITEGVKRVLALHAVRLK